MDLVSYSFEIVSVGTLLKPKPKNDTVGGQKALADDTDAGKDNSSIAGFRRGIHPESCLTQDEPEAEESPHAGSPSDWNFLSHAG
jgi:hypothetical protein